MFTNFVKVSGLEACKPSVLKDTFGRACQKRNCSAAPSNGGGAVTLPNCPAYHLPHQDQSNFSQPVTMPGLHFYTERLGFKDPETPETLRKEWWSVFAILRDYVQPDSTLFLDEAVDRAAKFYTDGYQKNSPINHTLIILGDQIPYDNPAHIKLAYFFLALGKSRKWLVKSVYVRTLTSFEQSNTLTDMK
jgi:hypothetical protein